MKAILYTLCGCTKVMEVGEARPEIIVPLVRGFNNFALADQLSESLTFEVRRFRRIEIRNLSPIGYIAIYEEEYYPV